MTMTSTEIRPEGVAEGGVAEELVEEVVIVAPVVVAAGFLPGG